MAVIPLQHPDKLAGKSGQALWETLTCGDTGAWQLLDDYNDNTVTVSGTFNSETLTMQGTNDGGTTVFTLTDPSATAIALTAAGGKLIVEAPKEIRPSFSGSSGGDVDVRVQMRKV
ncbi:MAG: hypothetical protein V3U75_13575 [Methylococcaceae bacterium]